MVPSASEEADPLTFTVSRFVVPVNAAVGAAFTGPPPVVLARPGVPPVVDRARQLAGTELSAVGDASSSEGPVPSAAVGHGATFEYVTESTTRVPCASTTASPESSSEPVNSPPTNRLAPV